MNTGVFAFLDHPIAQRLGWTLIHSLWQGVIFAAALALVLRLLRSAPANLRYLASCGAMAMLVLAAGITFTQIQIATSPIASPLKTDDGYVQTLPVLAVPAVNAPSSGIEPQSATHDELRWIVLAWAIGVVAMSLWHLAGWLWLARMRRGVRLERWEPALAKLMGRLGIRGAVRLIETSRIDVPAVIGVLRPVICVPVGIFSGLSPQQVEAILAHELAHIRRHDYLVNLIQSAIETLLFYHPATWWISGQIRRERENSCDDIAAAITGDERAYASALAALEGRRASLPFALAATDGSLLDRVRRVLHLPPAHRPNRIHSLAATVLAIVCVVVPLACVGAKAQQNKAASTTQVASEYTYVNVVIGKQSLLYDGKAIELADLEKTLDAIPQSNRSKTVLAVAAGSPNVTVERYFNVSARLSNLVKKYGLAYLSDTGIHPTTEPADGPRADVGEYYMNGVKRPGVYSIGERKITLKQALMAAGGTEVDSRVAKVTLVRREGDKETTVVKDLPVDDLTDGKAREDPYLKPSDMIIVKPESTVAVLELGALIKQRDDLASAAAELKQKVGAQSPQLMQIQELVKQLDERIEKLGGSGWTENKASSKPAAGTTTAPQGSAGALPDDLAATAQRLAKDDPEMLKLLEERAATAMQLESASKQLGLDHPMIRVLTSTLADLDARIRQRSDEGRIGRIAQADPTMREYQRLLEQFKVRFEQVKRSVGPNSRIYQDAAADIRIQQQRIDAYADSWEKASHGATRP